MWNNVFASMDQLLMGGLAGFVFGFLLHKGGVSRYDVIVNQFLLKDFTVAKIIVTAIAVGGIGIYAMKAFGVDFNFHVKTAALWGNIVGGLIFGAGMVLLGYCPGTCVAAMGEGSRHALFGFLGMVAGAIVFAELYPWIRSVFLSSADLGKITLPELTGLPTWLFFAVLSGAVLLMYRMKNI
ncbi:MAG: YeeE/YedE family protein [Candidatus Nitrohelix vancouverensis]|uniref:YeeE/YedE family protein n=1 Tax=Candidatus Nitrohelix vancouverensis TaxID=2705534 RepID=A0A7T0C308_9BACT|nr:MAG: YeeE/YedE family protein [Candidatus Nitrohelix vancouverensis]